ncbi:MAG: hypothetical protein OXC06_08880 [Acidimicrobiaceae bacterium]|nr:hypothetical protein [Acidimicrobiaceae bacterium]
MLTVYSTQGSPGASTTAMHLAAHWASSGREVLLIETDPAGGSLSHNLGIQFTPGSASFVASGLTVQSNHLIDHAQDVLFESLHVMPAPASPTGARGIFEIFAAFAGDLRTISENEMAVIIDGGRISADTAASALTTEAAGVVVVCRDNSQLSSVGHLTEALASGPGDGPVGCAVTVGKSPMSPEEWQESCGLGFCGSIETVSDMATDLSAYLTKGKRKSKKWRASLEQVGESLYQYAHPPMSDRSRRARPAEPATMPGADAAGGTDGSARAAAAGSGPPAGHDPAAHAQAPPTAPPEGLLAHGRPAPPMAPAAGAGFDPSHHPQPGYPPSHHPPPAPDPQPGYPPSHHPPPTGWPTDPGAPQGYGEPPPPEGRPAYGQPAPPPYPPAQFPAHPYEQPHYPPPEAHEQPQYPPPGTYEQPPAHQQPPEAHEQPPAHQQPPEAYEQPQYPPPGTYEPPQYPAHPYGQPTTQPEPPAQQAPHEPPPQTQAAPRPNIQPTGSFRDWAVKLHGSNARDMAADRGG